MRRTLAPLLFDDEQLPGDRLSRDPAAPAEPSAAAKRKKQLRQTAGGLAVHSFSTLLGELGRCCGSACRTNAGGSGAGFKLLTELTPLQAKAFRLLGL